MSQPRDKAGKFALPKHAAQHEKAKQLQDPAMLEGARIRKPRQAKAAGLEKSLLDRGAVRDNNQAQQSATIATESAGDELARAQQFGDTRPELDLDNEANDEV